MRQAIIPVLGIALIFLSDYVHGWVFDREGQEQALFDASSRLERVPLQVRGWKGEDLEVDPDEMERAEVTGWLSRQYVHQTTGEAVQLLVVCGPAGPVSVHPPDVCFRGQGYELDREPRQYQLRAPGVASAAKVWFADFEGEGTSLSRDLRTFWTWCDERGTWQAPSNPRFEFAGSPFLYKLYVVRTGTTANDSLSDDSCSRFFRALLPELQRTLFSPQSG